MQVIIFCCIISFCSVYAQEPDYVLSKDSVGKSNLPYVGLNMGAFIGGGGEYFGTFYQPSIAYDVSSRFTLSSGFGYSNSSLGTIPVLTNYRYQFFSGNISQYYAFVKGQYMVNDKLSVGGAVFYNFSSLNIPGLEGQNDQVSKFGQMGYAANFRYKVRRGMFIEGEVRIGDNSPYGFNSGFLSNRFSGNSGSLFFMGY